MAIPYYRPTYYADNPYTASFKQKAVNTANVKRAIAICGLRADPGRSISERLTTQCFLPPAFSGGFFLGCVLSCFFGFR